MYYWRVIEGYCYIALSFTENNWMIIVGALILLIVLTYFFIKYISCCVIIPKNEAIAIDK